MLGVAVLVHYLIFEDVLYSLGLLQAGVTG